MLKLVAASQNYLLKVIFTAFLFRWVGEHILQCSVTLHSPCPGPRRSPRCRRRSRCGSAPRTRWSRTRWRPWGRRWGRTGAAPAHHPPQLQQHSVVVYIAVVVVVVVVEICRAGWLWCHGRGAAGWVLCTGAGTAVGYIVVVVVVDICRTAWAGDCCSWSLPLVRLVPATFKQCYRII